MPEDVGRFELTLSQAMRLRGMDSNRLSELTHINRDTLRCYVGGEVAWPDLRLLARICAALDCGIGDVLRYAPPEAHTEATCTTGEAAALINVHPNTVRFYEQVGWIAPAERAPNGYRRFTRRHIIQLRVCRIIMDDPYAGRTLRDAAFAVLAALRAWDLPQALENARTYRRRVAREYAEALATAAMLKEWAECGVPTCGVPTVAPANGLTYTRREAAALFELTPETLRGWERNGLLAVPRVGANRTRVYGAEEIARLRVIYLLRCNHYAVSAIKRAMSAFDEGRAEGAVLALVRPDADIDFISASDRWLATLEIIAAGAERIEQAVSRAGEPGEASNYIPPIKR